jgi:hypothetical protein
VGWRRKASKPGRKAAVPAAEKKRERLGGQMFDGILRRIARHDVGPSAIADHSIAGQL